MKPYSVTTEVAGRVVRTQEIDDPFIVNKTVIGFRDLLRALPRRKLTVGLRVDGRGSAIAAVMNIDHDKAEELWQSGRPAAMVGGGTNGVLSKSRKR